METERAKWKEPVYYNNIIYGRAERPRSENVPAVHREKRPSGSLRLLRYDKTAHKNVSAGVAFVRFQGISVRP